MPLVCGAGPHPSTRLEGMIGGEGASEAAMMAQVKVRSVGASVTDTTTVLRLFVRLCARVSECFSPGSTLLLHPLGMLLRSILLAFLYSTQMFHFSLFLVFAVPTHICTLLFIIAFLAFQMPVLLLPAGDDPDNVKPGGEVASLVEGKGGASVVFPEMKHGWYTHAFAVAVVVVVVVHCFHPIFFCISVFFVSRCMILLCISCFQFPKGNLGLKKNLNAFVVSPLLSNHFFIGCPEETSLILPSSAMQKRPSPKSWSTSRPTLHK